MKTSITIPAIILAALVLAPAFAAGEKTEGIPPKIKIGKNPNISVRLMNSTTTVTLCPMTERNITDNATGKKLATLSANTTVTIELVGNEMVLNDGTKLGAGPILLKAPKGEDLIAIAKVPYGVSWWWENTQDRRYCGDLFITPDKGKLLVCDRLPLEEYIRGVVPSEIGSDSPIDALGAQAVAARSAAVLSLTTDIYSKSEHYNITSDVDSQAFSGLTINSKNSDEAVRKSEGVILAFEGRPVSAYYASSCGGYTEDIRNVWDERADDKAYWDTAVFDGDKEKKTDLDLTTEEGVTKWINSDPIAYCNPKHYEVPAWANKNFRWTAQYTNDEMTSFCAKIKDIGTFKEVRAIKRGPSGRMIEAEFIGDKGSFKIGKELKIRSVWTPPLKSACFITETSATLSAEGKEGKPGIVLKGCGWGHGVGMCQTGAVGMAKSGKDYKAILSHYFPNCTLEKLY